MNELAVIIGKHIEELRVSRDMPKTKLAELLEISRPTLNSYIKGEQIIDSAKLAVLAKEFNKSMDYFLSPKSEGYSSLMYRAERASDTPSEIIERIVRRFELYSDLLKSIKQKSVFVPPTYSLRLDSERKLTDDDKRAIEEVALKCRYGLELDGVTGQDLFLALEEVGINILAFSTDPQAEVWAASAFSHEDGAFIYVNDDRSIPEERKIFSLIHELAHLVLHRDRYSHADSELKYASRRKDINERVANHFASCFLLPRHKLEQDMKIIGKDLHYSTIIYLKQKYRVSFQAVLMALRNYDLLSPDKSNKFFARLNFQDMMQREPEPLPYFEKNQRYILYLRKLYCNGELGVNKVAEYLDLPLVEARKVVREWDSQG